LGRHPFEIDYHTDERCASVGSGATEPVDELMKKQPDAEDMIDVLVCDIQARPRGAPSIFDVSPYIESVVRSPESISISFAGAGAADVAAFVEAERLCCAAIDWRLEVGPAVVLTIGASPNQLDVFEQMFRQA
jgi:hypothetical protein